LAIFNTSSILFSILSLSKNLPDGCPTSEFLLLTTFPQLNRHARSCSVHCARKIAVAPVGGLQGGNALRNPAMAGN